VETARLRSVVEPLGYSAVLAEYAARQSALQLEIAKQYPDLHLSPGIRIHKGTVNGRSGGDAHLQPNHAIAEAPPNDQKPPPTSMPCKRVAGDIDRARWIPSRASKAKDAESLRKFVNRENCPSDGEAGRFPRWTWRVCGFNPALPLWLVSMRWLRPAGVGLIEDALQSRRPCGIGMAGVAAAFESES
jgi:hypothetical protein